MHLSKQHYVAIFAQPDAPAFSLDGTDCNVYWLHCPKELQSDYLALYRRAKQANPAIGACVLLPFKLPLTHIDLVKGFKLVHTFGRNTPMYYDHVNNTVVRSKCTMALWYDTPVRTLTDETKINTTATAVDTATSSLEAATTTSCNGSWCQYIGALRFRSCRL